jgi:hypothetical protein
MPRRHISLANGILIPVLFQRAGLFYASDEDKKTVAQNKTSLASSALGNKHSTK